MFENLMHINSSGEKLDFLSLGIYVNENDLRDYSWAYDSENNRITKMYKKIEKKKIPLRFLCQNEEESARIKNLFYEHFDKDVVNEKKGYFMINDYRLYGYVIESVKTNYNPWKKLLHISLTYVCDDPTWIKENTINFFTIDSELRKETNSYPYTYPYVYGESPGKNTISNLSVDDSEFKMIIYGPVEDPSITINDHVYNVNVDLLGGTYLVIDSKSKEIYTVNQFGKKENVFNKRNKEHNVFKKLEKGSNIVTWTGGFGFDLTVYEERSEPVWK